MLEELRQISKINKAYLICFPTGRFGFVGKVPANLLYADTDDKISEMLGAGCGQFLSRRTWNSAEDAINCAKSLGYDFE